MPIYEYACADGGQEFEALVRSGTVAPAPCGSCGHPRGTGDCGFG